MGAFDGEMDSGEAVISVPLEVEEVIRKAGFALLFKGLFLEDSEEDNMVE